MKLFHADKQFQPFHYERESDFEKDVVTNSKRFFGKTSIYIDAKRKIQTAALGNTIPDGYLFDMSDASNPEFFIVEVELTSHDFYRHIFPQITKFFGFYKNHKGQNELVEKIFAYINNDEEVKREFKQYPGEREIYKFVKDTLRKSQNILLIMDGEKKELPEILDTYSETWGKMVRVIQIKKFTHSGNRIYTMHPDFENIEFVEIEQELIDEEMAADYDESTHLEGVNEEIRNTYHELKEFILGLDSNLMFNPKKYYISIRKERNMAFFLLGRKKLRLVVLMQEEKVRQLIKHHTIKTLTASVQKFWNGPSCAIIIENSTDLQEIKSLFADILGKQ